MFFALIQIKLHMMPTLTFEITTNGWNYIDRFYIFVFNVIVQNDVFNICITKNNKYICQIVYIFRRISSIDLAFAI